MHHLDFLAKFLVYFLRKKSQPKVHADVTISCYFSLNVSLLGTTLCHQRGTLNTRVMLKPKYFDNPGAKTKCTTLTFSLNSWYIFWEKNHSRKCTRMLLFHVIARFPFVDWPELLKACHSMSKPSSPHEKSVMWHAYELLRIIIR